MVQIVKNWCRHYFSNTETNILWLFILFVVMAFAFFGKMLAPVLASIVITYLLQWFVTRLEHYRCPHVLAVVIVYVLFLSAVVIAIVGLLPLLWRQLSNLVNELPVLVVRGQTLLMRLPEYYPSYISFHELQQLISDFKIELGRFGQFLLSASVFLIPNVIAVVLYFVLVPLLVYFFLMDRQRIMQWLMQYLPNERRLITQVWDEVHTQIGNYVRGKVAEMLIVWLVTYVAFALFGLQYAMLLSLLVGVSVIVPYIGAVVVTVPVLIVGFLQWGWSTNYFYLIAVYTLIITLDGNVLVPFLFSEAVSLHPVAIIIAILVFGGLWGFWGIFFAIPLATVVKALLNAFSNVKVIESKV